MNGHEHERLSAYLDGELPPEERAAVEAHLSACTECSSFLAAVAAVDEAAGALPAEAPEGYFDGFASRVMARLEPAARAAVRRPRLPVWTWAAAAALLLAVVTPLTLRRVRPEPTPVTTPTPAASVTPTEIPPAPEKAATRTGKARPTAPAGPDHPRPPSAPAASAAASVPAAPSAAEESERKSEAGFAPPPIPVRAAPALEAVGGAPPRDAAAVPGSAVRQEPPLATAEGLVAPAEDAREPAPGAEAPSSSNRAPSGRSVEARPQVLGKGAAVGDEELAFRRLDGARPRTVEAWRRLRDDWSAFAAARPADLRTDEARVRAIEAGREAWLLGGDEHDHAVFRRDATVYLEREDALQKDRVERLLREPRPAP